MSRILIDTIETGKTLSFDREFSTRSLERKNYGSAELENLLDYTNTHTFLLKNNILILDLPNCFGRV